MRGFRTLVSAALAVGMLLGVAGTAFADGPGHNGGKGPSLRGAVAQQAHFDDLGGDGWAQPFITELAMQGIVEGEAPGVFAPNQGVTHAQAITMVDRLLAPPGVAQTDGQALLKTSGYLKFSDAALIPSWAAPYVAFAVQDGVIANSGVLEPDAVATRAWAANLIVQAVQASGDLSASQEAAYAATSAGFSDQSSIPSADVAAVNVAVALGIVSGFPDGTFRPAVPVTRAEFAKMVAVVDHIFQASRNGEQVGTVVSLSTSADTVTLTTYGSVYGMAGSTTTTYTLAPNAVIYILPSRGQAQVGSLSQVSAGDHARYFVNTNGQIASMWVSFRTTEVEGVISQVTSGQITVVSEGASQTYSLAPGALIQRGHADLTASALQAGQRVHLQVHGGAAVLVLVQGSPAQHPSTGHQSGKDNGHKGGDSGKDGSGAGQQDN